MTADIPNGRGGRATYIQTHPITGILYSVHSTGSIQAVNQKRRGGGID